MKTLRALLARLLKNGCRSNCRQGREPCKQPDTCYPNLYAPLRTAEGGETVDAPPYTAEQVGGWYDFIVVGTVALFLIVALGAALVAFLNWRTN